MELKHCPFCGGMCIHVGKDYGGMFYVECDTCPCSLGKGADWDGDDMGYFESYEEAVTEWNKRSK